MNIIKEAREHTRLYKLIVNVLIKHSAYREYSEISVLAEELTKKLMKEDLEN